MNENYQIFNKKLTNLCIISTRNIITTSYKYYCKKIGIYHLIHTNNIHNAKHWLKIIDTNSMIKWILTNIIIK